MTCEYCGASPAALRRCLSIVAACCEECEQRWNAPAVCFRCDDATATPGSPYCQPCKEAVEDIAQQEAISSYYGGAGSVEGDNIAGRRG